MAIETSLIGSYKGPQHLSISYYAHKSDAQDSSRPAGTILEQAVRLSVAGEIKYEHRVNTLYPKDDIISIVRREAESWKSQQLGFDQVKEQLKDLEMKLAGK